jgi:hypothetical protein
MMTTEEIHKQVESLAGELSMPNVMVQIEHWKDSDIKIRVVMYSDNPRISISADTPFDNPNFESLKLRLRAEHLEELERVKQLTE